MARPERFELPTFWFVARHSIQLSYGRTLIYSVTQRRMLMPDGAAIRRWERILTFPVGPLKV